MMPLVAPPERDLTLPTSRLILEPITIEHAPEMEQVLSNPDLYRYIPSDPPTLADLVHRYRRWTARNSPDGKELWLNWAARRKADGQLIGHFQAGLDEQHDVAIAYMVAPQYQRRGYAFEALVAVCSYVRSALDARRVRAWIDARNHASIALARKLGMRESARIDKADFFKGSSSDEVVFELVVAPEVEQRFLAP